MDAIVIRNPEQCNTFSPKKTFSEKSLDEHVEIINRYNIEKAVIICENIDFIIKCPSLKYLEIIPADTVTDDFDYSPLYKMPNLTHLRCRTTAGLAETPLKTCIDYSKINGLKSLVVTGNGHKNYGLVHSLESLDINDCKSFDVSVLKDLKNLKNLQIFKCGLSTLNGISKLENLQKLNIMYNRNLSDISEAGDLGESLKCFYVENCPKIKDFSFINHLVNLEHLELFGVNKVHNLGFLDKMPNLKTFSFSMEIESGDLTPCLDVPYVWCKKGRKYYNLKDKDLPKNLTPIN